MGCPRNLENCRGCDFHTLSHKFTLEDPVTRDTWLHWEGACGYWWPDQKRMSDVRPSQRIVVKEVSTIFRHPPTVKQNTEKEYTVAW